MNVGVFAAEQLKSCPPAVLRPQAILSGRGGTLEERYVALTLVTRGQHTTGKVVTKDVPLGFTSFATTLGAAVGACARSEIYIIINLTPLLDGAERQRARIAGGYIPRLLVFVCSFLSISFHSRQNASKCHSSQLRPADGALIRLFGLTPKVDSKLLIRAHDVPV